MQERSRRKRDALLAAAAHVFAKRGFEAATIETIAGHAGIAVGGFYQHFASKRQLLLVLMDRLLSDIDAFDFAQQPSPGADSRAIVEAVVRGGLRVDWSHAGVYRAWREAVANDAALAKLDARIAKFTAGRIAAALRLIGELPRARADVNVDVLAEVLNELFWRLAQTSAERRAAVAAVVVDLVAHAVLYDSV